MAYTEKSIRTLDWREHIRTRPGMYIGKAGDGQSPDDGIYILFKEVIDNSVDEHFMGFGREIEVNLDDREGKISVRDYGRGIPLEKVRDCVSRINTGGKYDDSAFQKSVGLNGVGIKAVNALSSSFTVCSFRGGQAKRLDFHRGELEKDFPLNPTSERDGTYISFIPDDQIFKNFSFQESILEDRLWVYAFLNTRLKLSFGGKSYHSRRGLVDLLEKEIGLGNMSYPPIHLETDDLVCVLSHQNRSTESYYPFVNGQHTPQGGTHLNACKESLVQVFRQFYKKDFHAQDIRSGLVLSLSLRIQDPVFESQTKTKLGSTHLKSQGITLRTFILRFLQEQLDNYLHQNPPTAELILNRILSNEKERKEILGLKKVAQERRRNARLHNKKLRDCQVHFTHKKHPRHKETTLFITEGNSASGSITKSRDTQVHAVFSLRGKPLNCFGLSEKVVYENEEFNLLHHALCIDGKGDNLDFHPPRYNRIVLATDADVDGMHIRLLILSFFLQFFPSWVSAGHVYVLETPLFRVRNRKKTRYCYTEEEKIRAIQELPQHEITRFKGLGEISPEEFKGFIGPQMRLLSVRTEKMLNDANFLSFYMGKNTPERQQFILQNLRVEKNDF
ncbi:MAG: ATP-binding protein [Cytophagales bacterium]|nr:ATP-binding protein [Cytophagales bacterium]